MLKETIWEVLCLSQYRFFCVWLELGSPEWKTVLCVLTAPVLLPACIPAPSCGYKSSVLLSTSTYTSIRALIEKERKELPNNHESKSYFLTTNISKKGKCQICILITKYALPCISERLSLGEGGRGKGTKTIAKRSPVLPATSALLSRLWNAYQTLKGEKEISLWKAVRKGMDAAAFIHLFQWASDRLLRSSGFPHQVSRGKLSAVYFTA